MATNSWSKSLRKVRWRSQSKQRDRHFGVLRPLCVRYRFRLAVSDARDLVHQLVHRSASCTWMHGPGEHQQQKNVMLRRRNVVPVVLVVLGLDPTLVQVRSSCHFMSFCLPVSPKNLESIICIAISTGLSSDNFSSNTSHLSTAVFQRCEQRKGWSQSAGTTCSSSWRGSWHLFRQSPRTNIELANHLKHLESAGWSSRCLKKLLAFSSPRGFGRACLQESQGI